MFCVCGVAYSVRRAGAARWMIRWRINGAPRLFICAAQEAPFGPPWVPTARVLLAEAGVNVPWCERRSARMIPREQATKNLLISAPKEAIKSYELKGTGSAARRLLDKRP